MTFFVAIANGVAVGVMLMVSFLFMSAFFGGPFRLPKMAKESGWPKAIFAYLMSVIITGGIIALMIVFIIWTDQFHVQTAVAIIGGLIGFVIGLLLMMKAYRWLDIPLPDLGDTI